MGSRSNFDFRHFLLRTSDFQLAIYDFRLQTSNFELPTANFQFPTSHFGLRTSPEGRRERKLWLAEYVGRRDVHDSPSAACSRLLSVGSSTLRGDTGEDPVCSLEVRYVPSSGVCYHILAHCALPVRPQPNIRLHKTL